MKKFVVAASYGNECCARAHVWLAVVEADTRDGAEARLREALEGEGATTYEVQVLPASAVTL